MARGRYYVEMQVPDVTRDASGQVALNPGVQRWVLVGGEADEETAGVVYKEMLRQGLKVRVTRYGPVVVASYEDEPKASGLIEHQERAEVAPRPMMTAPSITGRTITVSGPVDAGSPLFDQLIKVADGRVVLPSVADLQAEAEKEAATTPVDLTKAAVEEVPENSGAEAPAEQEDMHPDAVYGREFVARAEAAKTEAADDTQLDLMPGDPGFLDAFKAAQASQAAAANRMLHRHEGTVRSTRSAQANS